MSFENRGFRWRRRIAQHENCFSLCFWFSIYAIWSWRRNCPSTFSDAPTSSSSAFPSARFASPDPAASLLLGRWCCSPTRAAFEVCAVRASLPSAFAHHTTGWCPPAVRSLCSSPYPFSCRLCIQSWCFLRCRAGEENLDDTTYGKSSTIDALTLDILTIEY